MDIFSFKFTVEVDSSRYTIKCVMDNNYLHNVLFVCIMVFYHVNMYDEVMHLKVNVYQKNYRKILVTQSFNVVA
jgi:hypothetical protein